MKTKIVKMGNTVGICIPKIILEQCHMDKFVDIQILDNKLVINAIDEDIKKNLTSKLSEADIRLHEESCWYEDESEWK